MKFGVMVLVYAFLSAISNALLSLGQKKVVSIGNRFMFLAIAAFVFFLCNLVAGLLTDNGFSGMQNIISEKHDLFWSIVCGIALFLLYCFYNKLITRYGATSYIIYSVMSVFCTAIVVGVLIFGEKVNRWHVLGIIAGCVSVVLFSIGNYKR